MRETREQERERDALLVVVGGATFWELLCSAPPTTNDDRGRRTRRRIRRNEHKRAIQIATALLKESDDSTNEKEEMMTTSSSSSSSSGTAAKEILNRVWHPALYNVLTPLAGLLLSQLVLYIGVGVLLPALPLYAQSIGLSQSANGLVISAPALAMLILNVPTGQMDDRYGRKPVMLTGLGIMAVADIDSGSEVDAVSDSDEVVSWGWSSSLRKWRSSVFSGFN